MMHLREASRRGRGLLLVPLLILLLAFAAACGGGGESTSAPTPAAKAGGQSAAVQATQPSTASQPTKAAAQSAEKTSTTPAAGQAAATPAGSAQTAAGTPAAGGQTASNQPGSITITVVRGHMMETMRKLADAYQQANPGRTVNVVVEPEGGAFEALIAAGNQPDIFVGSFGPQVGKYAAQQSLVPMDDLPGAKELFDKLDKETVQDLYGHKYYVPIGADVTMMIYNKELFKEAGLDAEKPPKTWAEFLDAAKKIQGLPNRPNGDKVYGTVFWNEALAWGGWYWNMLQPIYLTANQNKCLLLNRLGSDVVFDKPECKLTDFFKFTRDAQQYAPPTMEKNFFSRSIGMWLQYGYSWEPNLKEAPEKPMVIGQDVGIAPIPTMNEGDKWFTTYGGRTLSIMKTNPERQAMAWDFIQFLMKDENNLTFLKELGYLPTITSMKTNEYFNDPARKPFVEALNNAVMPQQFATVDTVANKILNLYQQTVVQKAVEPDQAVQTAANEARQSLKG